VAGRIVAVVGDPSDVARIGGDQFAVVVRVTSPPPAGPAPSCSSGSPSRSPSRPASTSSVTASLGCWPLDDQGIGRRPHRRQSAAKRARRLGRQPLAGRRRAALGRPPDGRRPCTAPSSAEELHLVYQPRVRLRDGVVTGVGGAPAVGRPRARLDPARGLHPRRGGRRPGGAPRELGPPEACTAASGWRLPRTAVRPWSPSTSRPASSARPSTLRQAAVDALAASGLPADACAWRSPSRPWPTTRRRRSRPCTSCGPSASGSPSTTSAPASRRSAT
jgi:hypothetical protein